MPSMDVVQEDDGLWDELSHQQSREIEQHRARASFHNNELPRANSSSTSDDVQRVARRAADEVGRFTRNIYQTTVDAYQESMKRQQRYRHSYRTVNQGGGDNYLDDFGLSSTRDNPLLSPADEESDIAIHTASPERNRGEEPRSSVPEGNFVLISDSNRRPVADGWGAVANLDLYFSSLYNYFYHRGLVPILCKGVVQLLTLFLTLYLSIFLFAHVDWVKLASCIDETTCHPDFFQDYYIAKPVTPGQSWTIWNTIVRLYFLIFLAFGLFSMWTFWQNVQDALKAKRIFEDRLGIPAHKLEGGAVDWDRDVVQKLCTLQESGEYRIAIHGQQTFDALFVAHRILRKENFFVALFNRNLLDFSVPFFGHGLVCSSLEWSVYFCIFNYMFNHKFGVRPAFYLDPSALKRRFIICGIGHALFMPFLLLFMLLHFGLRNAYDWKSTQQYLGPREWSPTAKWTFREFNELPHFFERRMGPSYEAAEGYLKLFGQNELMTAAGQILVFVGGSVGAVLLVFAAINDAILLHVKIYDWNLLWYAGIAGVVYSAGKGMLPNREDTSRNVRNIYAERDAALAKVANHTHYYPDIWKGRGWDKISHKNFSSMFQFKGQLFLREVLSLVLAPYTLCVSLPRCAESICEFVLTCKTEIPGGGEVCGFANFDFDKFSDETWEGKTLGFDGNGAGPIPGTFSQSVINLGFEEASKRFPKPQTKNGKMEKSFFGFKNSHPSWKVSESGQNLVDRVEQYQRAETAALAREQQLHVEAAARQLETLARLEQQRAHETVETKNEEHFAFQAPADAGAGNVPATIRQPALQPPPPVAFSQLQIPRNVSETANSDATNDTDSAPFAVGLNQQSVMSVSPFLSSRPSALATSQSAVPSLSRSRSIPGPGTSLALSEDVLRLLNMSSLEMGSLLEDPPDSHNEERQYMWLERYHAHLRNPPPPNPHDSDNIV